MPDLLQVALDVPASQEDAAGGAVDHFERGVLLLLEAGAKMPVEEADGDLLVVIERGQRLGRNEGEDAPGRGDAGRQLRVSLECPIRAQTSPNAPAEPCHRSVGK